LHFNDGMLAGLKLIGFSVWERRSGVTQRLSIGANQSRSVSLPSIWKK
jgi:hypothetical protein